MDVLSVAMDFRYYQQEADDAIYDHLVTKNGTRCLVKMFCGTGKSKVMRYCRAAKDQLLVAYVFPSLALVDQFTTDYLHDHTAEHVLKVCSELEATTDAQVIQMFLQQYAEEAKVVCVTYQSFNTLLDSIAAIGITIDVCFFDEAHHVMGQTYERLIFDEDIHDKCRKQVFLTATPLEKMYEVCGPVVYHFPYLRGVQEEFLNPFEIRVDMYGGDTNTVFSVYECIARAILTTGNSRVLTFHAAVNTDTDTSVRQFLNQEAFERAYEKVAAEEFPSFRGRKITFVGLYAEIPLRQRREILNEFDASPDEDIYIIASCQTIGEGVDTKRANMTVFVDPRASYVTITQNIGRIVRKQLGRQVPRSTILLPCWVDKTKYLACEGDREACDKVLREDLTSSSHGNFTSILNVAAALKQEDDELYNICLHYTDRFSPDEIKGALRRQGYQLGAKVGMGSLLETLEWMLLQDDEQPAATIASPSKKRKFESDSDSDQEDTDSDYDMESNNSVISFDYEEYAETCDTDEEILARVAADHDICIEVFCDNLDTPVERYNEETGSGKVIRLFHIDNNSDENGINVDLDDDDDELAEEDKEEEDDLWRPVVTIANKQKRTTDVGAVNGPKRQSRPRLDTHVSDDVRVLWSICGDIDVEKALCSYVVDCEVVGYDPLKQAEGIVQRARARELVNGQLMPRYLIKAKQTTPELAQEAKDAVKLQVWKAVVNGRRSKSICYPSVKEYLDRELPGWSDMHDLELDALNSAKGIVQRARTRESNGEKLMPRKIKTAKQTTPELKQEARDAQKLNAWKMSINGKLRDQVCYSSVKNYLDLELPGWDYIQNLEAEALEFAVSIVGRAKERNMQKQQLIPRKIKTEKQTTPELKQEARDAQKLNAWKMSINGKFKGQVYPSVKNYLDRELPGWDYIQNLEAEALEFAVSIVGRAKERLMLKEQLLPRYTYTANQTTPELRQEARDAAKLNTWKVAVNATSRDGTKCGNKCYPSVKDYLDRELPGWADARDLKAEALEFAESIVTRARERLTLKEHLLPRNLARAKQTTPELRQEARDAVKLKAWKASVNTTSENGHVCYPSIKKYLDRELPGWSDTHDLEAEALVVAESIVKRAKERQALPRVRANQTTPELQQEAKDCYKLKVWKAAINGKKTNSVCYPSVKEYLDRELPGWRGEDVQSEAADDSTVSDLTTESQAPKTKRVKKSTKLFVPAAAAAVVVAATSLPGTNRPATTKPELSVLHQRYKSMTSVHLHQAFQANPDEWEHYHALAEANDLTFEEHNIPRNRVIARLNEMRINRQYQPALLVVDMGCGRAHIARHFQEQGDQRFQFINYDHVSSNPDLVTVCDVASMPLENHSVNVCILCLAMWGSNCEEYLKEAKRVLASGGRLIVAEPTKRWTSVKELTKNDMDVDVVLLEPAPAAAPVADRLLALLHQHGFMVIYSDITKFALLECIVL